MDRASSLKGNDTNAEGFRDDLNGYIDSLAASPVQKSSMRAFGWSLQRALTVNLNDPLAVTAVVEAINVAVICMWKTHPGQSASANVAEIERMVVNTKQRHDAYNRFNLALNGIVVSNRKALKCE